MKGNKLLKHFYITIIVGIILVGCYTETPSILPAENSFMSITTVDEEDGIYRLWFMTEDAGIFYQFGKYDNERGWTAVPDGSVVGDRGAHGFARYGISTFSYENEIADIKEEYGYFVGGDGKIYELRFSSQYSFARWREGELPEGPANGPIAAVTYKTTDADMYAVAVLGGPPNNQLYHFSESLLLAFQDADYTLPTFTLAHPDASGLDPHASLVATTLETSPESPASMQPAYFFSRLEDGRLFTLYIGPDGPVRHLYLGPESAPIGYGIAAVGIGDDEDGIIHVFTTANPDDPDSERGRLYHIGLSPQLEVVSEWHQLVLDGLARPAFLKYRNKISADYTINSVSGNTEITVTGVNDDFGGFDVARMTSELPPVIFEFSYFADYFVSQYLPMELHEQIDGVFARYLTDPYTGMEQRAVFANGPIFNFVADYSPPDYWTKHRVKNLGIGHSKGHRITDLPLPHGEISLAHFRPNPVTTPSRFKNYLLAASTVYDNLPYVTLSASFNDGISWDVRDIRLEVTEGVQQEVTPRFQSNPIIAPSTTHSFIMVLEGIEDASAPPESECIPGGNYIYPAQLKVYPVKPYTERIEIQEPVNILDEVRGKYSHPWIESHGRDYGYDRDLLYYSWRDENEDSIKFAIAKNTDLKAQYIGKVEFEGADIRFAPMLYVRKDGIVLLLHGEKSNPGLCFIDPVADYNDINDTYKCHKHVYLDDEIGIEAKQKIIKFQYNNNYWPTNFGYIDGPQPWSMAAPPIGTRIPYEKGYMLYVFTGPNDNGDEFSDVYFSYSTDGGDNWAEAIRLGPSEADESSYQFGPTVSAMPDGTSFVTYYDMSDEYEGTVNRYIVRKGAILELIDDEYVLLDEIKTLGVVGDPENLPVHCGRVYENGEPIFPIHYIGDYIHVARNEPEKHRVATPSHGWLYFYDQFTHIHLVYPVTFLGEGHYTSQMFHDIVTPWNY